ncbi:U3 small nucleolar ribonucleoprotein protein MPP10-like [Uloborus diversus]|uniref:U3 small nucleolar ribonucleoprotein protein MPP10-like n=1 Tax=Uloborus diversus TaxID=327109 RepID=UPI00240A20FF|nr:U3 small nucleolar ribonucleoprotein protein MPP10-like [Uloborus diversus]
MAASMRKQKDHELNLLSRFSELFLSPEEFAEPQTSKVNEVKLITKDLYDNAYFSKSLNDFQTNSLPKLLIDGFDDEQIWQQIDLLNKSAVTQFSKGISNLDAEKVCLKTENSSTAPNAFKPQTHTNEFDELSSASDNEEYAFDGDSDSSVDVSHPSKRDDYAYDDDDDSESSNEYNKTDLRESVTSEDDFEFDTNDKTQEKSNKAVKPLVYKSEVDDQFFKLANLEEFLRLEDLKEEKGFEESSDEEDIDLFQDIPSDDVDDSDSDDGDNITKQKNVGQEMSVPVKVEWVLGKSLSDNAKDTCLLLKGNLKGWNKRI